MLHADADAFITFFADQIWNTRTGRCEASLSGHADSVEKVIWGGQGLLYTASRDRTIKVRGRSGVPVCARSVAVQPCSCRIRWVFLLTRKDEMNSSLLELRTSPFSFFNDKSRARLPRYEFREALVRLLVE